MDSPCGLSAPAEGQRSMADGGPALGPPRTETVCHGMPHSMRSVRSTESVQSAWPARPICIGRGSALVSSR